MRSISHEPSADLLEDELSFADWEALPASTRAANRMANVLILLGMIRDELHTEEGSSLLWMEEPVDRAFAEADRILRRLSF